MNKNNYITIAICAVFILITKIAVIDTNQPSYSHLSSESGEKATSATWGLATAVYSSLKSSFLKLDFTPEQSSNGENRPTPPSGKKNTIEGPSSKNNAIKQPPTKNNRATPPSSKENTPDLSREKGKEDETKELPSKNESTSQDESSEQTSPKRPLMEKMGEGSDNPKESESSYDNSRRLSATDIQNIQTHTPEFIQGVTTPLVPVETTGPWLTGPLIAKPNYCMSRGSLHFEIFASCEVPYGVYDGDWHINNVHPVISRMSFQPLIQLGLTSFMDISILPEFYFDLSGEVNQPWSSGDMTVELGFQLMGNSPFKTDPLLKISIGETLPVGAFQELDSNTKGAEVNGTGAFITTIGLLGGKLYHLGGVHWLSTRGELFFNFPNKVLVHGVNAYGGDPLTVGTVRPGASFEFILSGEFTVTQNFALSLDIVNLYTFKTTFTGITTDTVGSPSSYQLSVAPALEWNVSQRFGIIGGFWATVAGVNTPAFAHGTIGFNWFF